MSEVIRVACIGSREISPEMARLMEEVGEFIVEQQWYIASGNAIGSDAAYARGGNRVDPSHVILYVTGPKHNPHFIHPKNRVTWDIKPEWKEVARAHHPRYDELSPYVQALMDRNAGILSRAHMVLAFLNHNKPSGGGTGHGWKIAKTRGIPRLDLANLEPGPDAFEEICRFLLTHAQIRI